MLMVECLDKATGKLLRNRIKVPEIPSKEGLRVALDMGEQTIADYKGGVYGPEFSGVLTRAHDEILKRVIGYGYEGKNPRFAQWYAGAAYKMSEPQRMELTGADGDEIKKELTIIHSMPMGQGKKLR